MTDRNSRLARQLRAALRRSPWDAGAIAQRACVSRALMARMLIGDTDVGLRLYELIADQLGLSLECPARQEPEPSRWNAL